MLVEDELAKAVVEKTMMSFGLTNSKLIHVVPAGGWRNVLSLQKDLIEHNVLGIGRQIVSILDGDIKMQVGGEYKNLRKFFLPIKSVEKFLYNLLVTKVNNKFKKLLNDKYFQIDSLDSILAEFHNQQPTPPNHPEKKMYFKLCKDLESRNIPEKMFISNLCDDIISNSNFGQIT